MPRWDYLTTRSDFHLLNKTITRDIFFSHIKRVGNISPWVGPSVNYGQDKKNHLQQFNQSKFKQQTQRRVMTVQQLALGLIHDDGSSHPCGLHVP